MPRGIGPERIHFGGEDGVVVQIKNGKTSYYWECMHCQWRMGGKVFQNAKARIHLSGDVRLRTGIINTVCKNAPKEVMEQFAKLERTKRKEKNLKLISRKRASELLHASPAKKGRPRERYLFTKMI